MDDIIEYKANSKYAQEILTSEKALIRKSKHIFCSSLRLKKKLIERGAHEDQCSIIFNAFDKNSFTHEGASIRIDKKIDNFYIGYFGTISEWFDFELVHKAVIEIPEIIFYLVGPIENVKNLLPNHDRIIFTGPMDHRNLHKFSSELDLLVMPFHVTNLVLSVDPVKLYEYIFFDRPVLSVFYPGLERFKKFINFYEGHDQFILKIKQLSAFSDTKNKLSENDREVFLRCNSWDNRIVSISTILNAMKVRNDA
jgi:glycosyltransferase involved in cell wall biosynthesis